MTMALGTHVHLCLYVFRVFKNKTHTHTLIHTEYTLAKKKKKKEKNNTYREKIRPEKLTRTEYSQT